MGDVVGVGAWDGSARGEGGGVDLEMGVSVEGEVGDGDGSEVDDTCGVDVQFNERDSTISPNIVATNLRIVVRFCREVPKVHTWFRQVSTERVPLSTYLPRAIMR